jgi:hypothetical protein
MGLMVGEGSGCGCYWGRDGNWIDYGGDACREWGEGYVKGGRELRVVYITGRREEVLAEAAAKLNAIYPGKAVAYFLDDTPRN